MYSQMNMTALNIFEHPLNERMRAFFRVNELFRRAQHFLSASTEYDAQAAILTLLELSEVTGRFDLKARADERDRTPKCQLECATTNTRS